MATTGFWPVKGSLKSVLDYADNPDKTTNPKYVDDDLAQVLLFFSFILIHLVSFLGMKNDRGEHLAVSSRSDFCNSVLPIVLGNPSDAL